MILTRFGFRLLPVLAGALMLAGCADDAVAPRPTIEYRIKVSGVVFDAQMNRVPNAALEFENLTVSCGERPSFQPVQATSNQSGEFEVSLVLPPGYSPDPVRIGVIDTCSRLVGKAPGVGTDTMLVWTVSQSGSVDQRAMRVALQLR
ncbi:MAG TPA: hypothetical protein PLL69_11385 [Gemmatimonadales bacterium]|nr:hypothetical protein [Gemmatimonadales bacterium]